MDAREHELVVAVDGPGVTPATVDTRLMLEVALKYVEALQDAADELGEPITCTGLEIRHGSAGAACRTNQPVDEAADALADDLRSENPSARARALLEVAGRLGALSIKVANENGRTWTVEPRPTEGPTRTAVTARVKVVRAGGATPAIRLEHVLTGRKFTLVVQDQQVAQAIAPYLYDEIDVRATVWKHDDGRWTDGRLESWLPLDDEDPAEAWARWFEPHAEHWRNLSGEELRRELGREE